MNLRFQPNCDNIDWELIPEILKTVGMAYHDVEIHRKTFSASASVVFVLDGEQLIGFGESDL